MDISGPQPTSRGWYPLVDRQRYFDGARWTEHVAPLTPRAPGISKAPVTPRPSNPVQALAIAFSRYADFEGRATRPEFWWYAVVQIAVLLPFALSVRIDPATGGPTNLLWVVVAVGWLVTLVPSVAVTVRRLHDADLSGRWILLSAIPAVGTLLLTVPMLLPSTRTFNRFGPPPTPHRTR